MCPLLTTEKLLDLGRKIWCSFVLDCLNAHTPKTLDRLQFTDARRENAYPLLLCFGAFGRRLSEVETFVRLLLGTHWKGDTVGDSLPNAEALRRWDACPSTSTTVSEEASR